MICSDTPTYGCVDGWVNMWVNGWGQIISLKIMGQFVAQCKTLRGVLWTIWDRTPLTYTSNAVYMCVVGYKGPKSSNGIQLSQFVEKLLHF